jgi:diphthine-ammonia ligase
MIMKLYSGRGEDGYSIHQCLFGGTAQSVVMLDYSEDVAALRGRLDEALKVLGADLEVGDCQHTSYLDVSIQGMWDAGNFGGKIPCRSIWSASGKRLAVALILDAS